MLATRNNELKFTATDLDMEIVETVPARAKGDGAATAPAHMLYDIVRKLPEGGDIEVARDGHQGRLTITCGQARFSLQTLPAEDFPSLSVDDLGHAFSMPAADLKRLIDKTRFAISTEETRYYLNGIYLHAAQGRQAGAARRGHRRPSPGPGRAAPAGRRRGHAGRDRAAQDRGRARRLLDDADGAVEIELSATEDSRLGSAAWR